MIQIIGKILEWSLKWEKRGIQRCREIYNKDKRNSEKSKSSAREDTRRNEEICYDIAKWLSYYLYFFSFSFYLIKKSIDVWERMTQRRYMGLYK